MKYISWIFFLTFLLACESSEKQKAKNPQWDFRTLVKPDQNPIIQSDSSYTFFDPIEEDTIQWQKADVFNPGAVVKDGKVYLLLRCEDNPDASLGRRTSRIGLAFSDDGLNFERHPTPVLYPDYDEFQEYDYPGGVEDPRVVETEEGQYVMVYTSWNYNIARLSVAVSEDLYNWEKTGPAFATAYNGKFLDLWSKSGSIITEMVDGRPVAKRRDGKYWMYWGEQFVNLAWSENLADWYPTLNPDSTLKELIKPRNGYFDSNLTECGPPAITNEEGIVLFYNGKNAEDERAATDLPRGMYSVGRVVFDPEDMMTVISRTDSYLMKPTLPHEITGQYQSGTTFAEGLVYFKEKWFMYYGTADSFVGVATSP